MKLEHLNKQYHNICLKWVKLFSKKHSLDFDYWVGDEIGGVGCFSSQYFFNLSDIVLDLNTEQPIGFILKWHEDGTDYNLNSEKRAFINYQSYIKGLRYEDLNENR